MSDGIILDASVMIEILRGKTSSGVNDRLRRESMHTPAHFDAEVLSGLCRLHRAGAMTEGQVERCLRDAAIAPIERHSIVSVMEAAWALRHNVRLADALYIALGVQMGMPVLTLDTGMASSSAIVELLDP